MRASTESHFSSIHIVRSPKRMGLSQSVSASFRSVYIRQPSSARTVGTTLRVLSM